MRQDCGADVSVWGRACAGHLLPAASPAATASAYHTSLQHTVLDASCPPPHQPRASHQPPPRRSLAREAATSSQRSGAVQEGRAAAVVSTGQAAASQQEPTGRACRLGSPVVHSLLRTWVLRGFVAFGCQRNTHCTASWIIERCITANSVARGGFHACGMDRCLIQYTSYMLCICGEEDTTVDNGM